MDLPSALPHMVEATAEHSMQHSMEHYVVHRTFGSALHGTFDWHLACALLPLVEVAVTVNEYLYSYGLYSYGPHGRDCQGGPAA